MTGLLRKNLDGKTSPKIAPWKKVGSKPALARVITGSFKFQRKPRSPRLIPMDGSG